MPVHTTGAIARHVGGTLEGAAEVAIRGVESLEAAGPDQLSFVRDPKQAARLAASRAGAVIVGPDLALPAPPDRPRIRAGDADIAVARALELFAPPPPAAAPGISPEASVSPEATLGEGVAVAAGCHVGPGVVLEDGVSLYPNVTVLDAARLGAQSILWPGVVVRERCTIGARCQLHPGAVLGADGFGYRPDPAGGGLIKIPHIGTVTLGDDVEIGAGTCIDRGKFSATTVGDGTRIDNLCQIGHNCRIGRSCLIAGMSGLSGSVTLGDGVVIGGGAGIRDQVSIGDGARIAAAAQVMNDVPAGATWAGYPARHARDALREYAAMSKLPDLARLLKRFRNPAGADPGKA